MGMFDDITKAQANANGGAYVRPGHYFARIDRVKAGKSQQDGKEFVAIEQTIVNTFPDGDLPVDKDFNRLSEEHWHRAGEQVTHLLQAKHQSFLGNMKAFIANVGGLDEKTVTPEHADKVCEGLFNGLIVEIRARTVKTRAGNPFTAVGYVREVPPSEVKERVDAETLERVLGPGKIDELVEAYGS